jgi:uncharacterized protein (TIGR02996 family)
MLEQLLQGIVEEPQTEDRWLVLGDWLEEHDDPRRAESLRLHRRLLATCCEPEKHPERAVWQARIVALLAEGVKPCVPQRKVLLDKGVEMTFSFIPPGSFLMGSPPEESKRHYLERPRHRVTLTKGYWLGVRKVTRKQCRRMSGRRLGEVKGNNDHPVVGLSWGDCQDLCLLSAKRTGQKFRLPTEAEWEHAARAGTSTSYFFGEDITVDQAKWRFLPNAWGLHDMHGDVREWVADEHAPYAEGDAVDPRAARGDDRYVLRGGGSARRWWSDSGNRRGGTGCRLVLCTD